MRKATKVSGLYASGIDWAFRGDSDGGVAVSEADEYIESQVFACLQVNTSDNPFQDLGVTQRAVFENPEDPEWRRILQDRIRTQFRFLDTNNLARLVRIKFSRDDAQDGNYGIVVEYTNLETNTQKTSVFAMSAEADIGLQRI